MDLVRPCTECDLFDYDDVNESVLLDLPLGGTMRKAFSGVVVTAGDVAFYGTLDGWFKAVDAKTGDVLWQFRTGSGIVGQPITYRGPDGKQYVAVLAGVGGWPGAIVTGVSPRD